MSAIAAIFMANHAWCDQVVETTAVFAMVGLLGVFRCTVARRGADNVTAWVVVGDLPPACLPYEPSDSWQDALRRYVVEMRRWVGAVRSGLPAGDDIIPVHLASTEMNAELVEMRLDILQSRLIDVDPGSVRNDVR